METFNLVIDQLTTVWERLYVEIEAESLKDAIAKCENGEYAEYDRETLYDTFETMSPSKEFPETEEIFLEDDLYNPVFTNSIRLQK